MTELDHRSCLAASVFIYSVTEKDDYSFYFFFHLRRIWWFCSFTESADSKSKVILAELRVGRWKVISQRCTNGANERTPDAPRCAAHALSEAFKVTTMKKQMPKMLKSHFSLSLTNTARPPSSSLCFFPPLLLLFLSLSLCSPCIVSLIGRQTACKCSNPEKSPGALVIGCALQHCSQSIKARWAPVNSFSLLLLWLWYCHIDSNFALNPSTAVLSLSPSRLFIL